MKIATINIPDEKIDEVLSVLNQLGVEVVSSKSSKINKPKKEDCQEHFLSDAPINNV